MKGHGVDAPPRPAALVVHHLAAPPRPAGRALWTAPSSMCAAPPSNRENKRVAREKWSSLKGLMRRRAGRGGPWTPTPTPGFFVSFRAVRPPFLPGPLRLRLQPDPQRNPYLCPRAACQPLPPPSRSHLPSPCSSSSYRPREAECESLCTRFQAAL